MPNETLTKKQRALVRELQEIAYLLSLDFYNIHNYDTETRTTYLELAKNKIIRGQIIIWYTLVDEHLNVELSHYFFGKQANLIKLWKTKRFQNFNYYILEELHLLQKLRFVRAIRKMPKRIVADIERLNSLRNGVAHAFFPENLRRSKPTYKGRSVFSLDGLRQLQEDMDQVFEFFGKFTW